MMNSIPALMYSWQIFNKGDESKFYYVSDYCQELLGVSAQDAVLDANRILNLILEEDVPAFSAATLRSRAHLTVFDCKVRMRRVTDGRIVTVHFKSRPRRQGTCATIWDGVAMEVPTLEDTPVPEPSETSMVDESIRLPIPHYYSSSQHQPQPQLQSPMMEDSLPRRAAVQQLVHAERSLTEWLSHEVRNPLSVTMEALQTLQELHEHEAPQDDEQVVGGYSAGECYQVMTESITYVVDLLNNMTDLDQCAQGQMPVVTAACTVKEDILLPTYRMMKRLRPKDGPVQLRLVPSALMEKEEVVAHVDKLRLRQVLTNLIANAFHFTTEGFVEVDLTIQDEPTKLLQGWGSSSSFAASAHHLPPRMLSFHVRDSGCGVKPCEYDTLFSRWDQLGTSRNGTGIGLCLCQALVRAMGGSIRLNTEYQSGIEGHPGAEFIVEVPMESAPFLPPSGEPLVQRGVSVSSPQPPPPQTTRALPDAALSQALFSTSTHEKVGSWMEPPSLPLLKPPPSMPMSMSTPMASVPTYSRSQESSPERRDSNGSSQPPSVIPLDSISSRSSSSSFVTAAGLASAMSAATTKPGRRSSMTAISSSSSPRKNHYFRGKYSFLIVDDEKMGRKFLKRRFSRLFPEATVTEVASGEEALAKAATQQYDVITMDHFMAINEMNGGETIRELRSSLQSDALIVGISGNDKQVEHLQAGADSFFQKPLPNDSTLVESLQQHLAPPAGWKVLILADDGSEASMLMERLYKVASPHFTTKEEAEKRWKMTTRPLGSSKETVEFLTAESFDLVVLVDPQTESEKEPCTSIRTHLSKMASSGDVLFVDCQRSSTISSGLTWSLNALPSIERMRQSLCESLLSVRGALEKTKSNTSIPSVHSTNTHLPPRRTNSGVAKSA